MAEPNVESSARRLAQALARPTISRTDRGQMDMGVFSEFRDFLAESFELVHERLEWEDVGELGRLYRLAGSDPSLEPVLLLAHYDVVPPGDEEAWTYPPFAGRIAEDCIWGRGALDDKGVLMAMLEALERRLAAGFEPARSLFFAFGGDEEVSGTLGACRIAALLEDRGIRFAATFDEGMVVSRGLLSFLDPPVALIGVAEKGYVDLALRATGAGGHAAMPPADTSVFRLASALLRVRRRRQADRILPVIEEFFRRVAPAARRPFASVLKRPRLFAPLLIRVLRGSPTTAALLRTTIAPTVLSGSEAANVLPPESTAVLNCRLLPGENVDDLRSEISRIVAATEDGSGARVELYDRAGATDPVGESSLHSDAFRWIEKAVRAAFPHAVIAPFLVTGTTDSRHYRRITRDIYRFVPLELDAAALATIHGVDERIPLGHYERAIRYYERLLELAGGVATERADDE